ncbi:GNAT family N-acetyltransferase [Desulfuromonas sp. DDH964]|uniref:GNAT family N-acetyltransferase n=1 Tax=Desulfuromonas sp. DDH964 TaxID=1823759 RepID=UPI00078DA6D6|nr:GNAT family N-acetyltransferase [Desulfuromonas sp. DDH964]AMV72722.1 GNAT family N-acetyltransferase [Desulfuromonas sp. DDH964]
MRKLERSDLPELERVLRATSAFTEPEVECAMELLHIVLDDPAQKDYLVAVADHEGKAAGYILYGPVPVTEGNFDIYWIATDPAVQGKGLGRALMEFAEADARARGARMVCLETSSQGGYQRTRRFYDQAGYIQESCIRDFYKPGDDRLTYVKRFSS